MFCPSKTVIICLGCSPGPLFLSEYRCPSVGRLYVCGSLESPFGFLPNVPSYRSMQNKDKISVNANFYHFMVITFLVASQAPHFSLRFCRLSYVFVGVVICSCEIQKGNFLLKYRKSYWRQNKLNDRDAFYFFLLIPCLNKKTKYPTKQTAT